MKLHNYLCLLILSGFLVACQVSTTKSPQMINTVVVPTETELSPNIEMSNHPTITADFIALPPVVLNTDIDFPTELQGKLIIGSGDLEQYFELNFDQPKIIYYKIPSNCLLVGNGREAICDIDSYSDKSIVYIYDLTNSQKIFPFDSAGGRWQLTSSERLLQYMRVDQSQIMIDVYDFDAKRSYYMGEFNHNGGRLFVPSISNTANSLIGLDNNQELGWEYDDQWYFMDTDELIFEPVIVPANIAATDSIEWSPDDTRIALIGFYRDDEIGHAGTLTCGKEVLIYDPIAHVIRKSIKTPEKRCITPTNIFYSHHMWSPDSSKLVLVLDTIDICIIDFTKDNSTCTLITNNFDTDEHLYGLTWSPDSNYIGYFLASGEIQIFSIKNNETYSIADLDDLSTSFFGDYLVWIH